MYASTSTQIVQVQISPGKFCKMSVELFKKRFEAGFHKGKEKKKGKSQ